MLKQTIASSVSQGLGGGTRKNVLSSAAVPNQRIGVGGEMKKREGRGGVVLLLLFIIINYYVIIIYYFF